MIDPTPRPEGPTEPHRQGPGSTEPFETPDMVGGMPLQADYPTTPVTAAAGPSAPLPPLQDAGAPPRRNTWLWWVLGGCAVLLLCCLCSVMLLAVTAALSSLGRFSNPPAIPAPRPVQPARPSSEVEPAPPAAANESPSGATGAPANGSSALDFTLKTVDGQAVRLSDFRGRPVIVNFWATWCGPCQVEMPLLAKAVEQNKDKNLVVLAVDQGEPVSVVKPWIEKKNFPFTIVLDEMGQVGQSYRVRAYPTTYVVDANGVVKSWQVGSLTQMTLDRHLAKLFQ